MGRQRMGYERKVDELEGLVEESERRLAVAMRENTGENLGNI